jgi:hypothetical protein
MIALSLHSNPKCLQKHGKQIYNYYSVKLNKGETYLVKSYPTPMGTGDLNRGRWSQ